MRPEASDGPANALIYGSDPLRLGRLRASIEAEPGIAVVGIAGDPARLAELADKLAIDVVLASSADIDWLAEWRTARQTPVVLVDEPGEAERALTALLAGAAAILPSTAEPRLIRSTLAAAAAGQAVLPRPLLDMLLAESSAGEAAAAGIRPEPSDLTPRELEVLGALAAGASNKAIARRLGISFHTVKFHVAGILAKLDADTRTEAVAKAAHAGLIML